MRKKLLCLFLTVLLVLSVTPFSVFAGHRCPDCDEWIDGDPYCRECYKCGDCVRLCEGCGDICEDCAPVCEECGLCEDCAGCEICAGCTSGLGEVICWDCAVASGNHCPECEACYFDEGDWCDICGRCYNCVDKCGSCSSGIGTSICIECAIDEGYHCPECEACYFEEGDWCDECGRCYNCTDKCDGCSSGLGYSICRECAIDAGYHCPECEACYFEEGDWCDECGRCYNCTDKCDGCSSGLGYSICRECAIDTGYHCPECEACYFEEGDWCDICGRCYNCVDKCDSCSSEEGKSICVECAIDAGYHCPVCNGCYDDADAHCEICGACSNCYDICTDCNSDGICMECAVEQGMHCPSCLACSTDAVICESCGNVCSECADEFCEDCRLCGDCAEFCPNCGRCSECADICPNCGEYCSECSDICSDCGFCEDCCRSISEAEGCDCDDWVCVENTDWDDHFVTVHSGNKGAHTAKASASWSFDKTNHWHRCLYCDNTSHYSDKSAHTYDKNGKCTVCGYYKNSKIQILAQPKDVTGACVSDANSDYSLNLAHFSVSAEGNGKLTYKWYCGHYNSRNELYKSLLDPDNCCETEDYEGSSISVVIPTDACYETAYYFCVITDEEGNTVTSDMAKIVAKHVYGRVVESNDDGHTLACVGEGCEADVKIRNHYDNNGDYKCDVCGRETDKTLRKINLLYDDVYASFIVGEKQIDFEQRLNSALGVESTAHTSLYLWAKDVCCLNNGSWYGMKSDAVIEKDGEYAVTFCIRGTLLDGTTLPSKSEATSSDFIYLNGMPLATSKYAIGRYVIDGNSIEIGITLYLTPSESSRYEIAVENGNAVGARSLGTSRALPGQTVYLTTCEDDAPKEGYVFSHWECTKGNVSIKNSGKERTSFVMPECAVEFKAVYVNPAESKAVYGDVNGDGKIKGNDATLLLKYLADWDVVICEENSDCNGDGKIKGNDATLLLKKLADWNVDFGGR